MEKNEAKASLCTCGHCVLGHTPGPWEVKSPPNDTHAFDVYGQGGHLKLHHGHWGGRADALLIAAAPLLLAELQRLIDRVEHYAPQMARNGDLDEARAAIAKAGGR
jgi:hypothetical protein